MKSELGEILKSVGIVLVVAGFIGLSILAAFLANLWGGIYWMFGTVGVLMILWGAVFCGLADDIKHGRL